MKIKLIGGVGQMTQEELVNHILQMVPQPREIQSFDHVENITSSTYIIPTPEGTPLYTNYKATATVSLKLPVDPRVSNSVAFEVAAPYELRVVVGKVGESFIIGNNTDIDNGDGTMYLVSSEMGSFIQLTYIDTDGIWLCSRASGTWLRIQPE